MSISAFRQRCARANELLKGRCRQGAGSTITSNLNDLNVAKEVKVENECIPLIYLGDENSIIASNSFWEKNATFGEISG